MVMMMMRMTTAAIIWIRPRKERERDERVLHYKQREKKNETLKAMIDFFDVDDDDEDD